jgi:transcriptional regulator with XRE-family HTH domain
VKDADITMPLLRELGLQLAALRREARLTQQALAARTNFSRPTVSIAEIGRQPMAREFWIACDQALSACGALTSGYDQVQAARAATRRAAARAAQEAREARALAALTAAQSHEGVITAVTALQPCPHCGSSIAVLTTLLAQLPPQAAAGRGKSSGPGASNGHRAAHRGRGDDGHV